MHRLGQTVMVKGETPCRKKTSTIFSSQNTSAAGLWRDLRNKSWQNDGETKGKGVNVMTVASRGGKKAWGPRLWTGERAHWKRIVRAQAEDLDRIQPRFDSIQSRFSLRMEISHTLAFCPRRVAHLCSPRRPPEALRETESRGIHSGTWKKKMQAPCHITSDGASSRLSPWTWPTPFSSLRSLSLSLSITHTHTHTWFTATSSGCQKVWTVPFLIQTNAAAEITELS